MIPKNTKKKNNNHLAEGETTGHYHEAVGTEVEVGEEGKNLFLSAPEGCEIIHQEHHRIAIPAGDYIVEKVKEFDHSEQEIRQVRD